MRRKPIPPSLDAATGDAAIGRRRAVLMVLGAAAVFTLAAAFVKALEGGIPLAQVIFCRNLFAIPALLPLLWRHGGLAALRTTNARLHAVRTATGLLGMAGAFYGYAVLPLATVTALGFTMPLFLTLLSVPLLRERIGPRRGAAVLAGFCGVLLMLGPGSGAGPGAGPGSGIGGGHTAAILLVLLGALGWALSMITIRRMGATGEPGVAIVLWFTFGAAAVSGLASIPVWLAPTPFQWAMLAGTGLVSALAQVLMTEGYRRGEATLLAPFEYSAILWTTLLGVLVWGELPDRWDFAGMAVLVASGLYIWRREMTLGIRR